MLRRTYVAISWVGKVTVFAVGLLMVALLVLGPISIGLAASGNALRLGKNNDVTKVTTMIGDLSTAILRLDNRDGSGPALELRVDDNQPPLTVDSDTKVTNLNADFLDGLNSDEFLRERSSGTVSVNPPALDGGDCSDMTADVDDANSNDPVLLFPDQNFTDNGPVTVLTNRAHSADEVSFTVCNPTDDSINPPDGTWGYVVLRQD